MSLPFMILSLFHFLPSYSISQVIDLHKGRARGIGTSFTYPVVSITVLGTKSHSVTVVWLIDQTHSKPGQMWAQELLLRALEGWY